MKKLTVLLLAAIMVISLASCGKKADDAGTGTTAANGTTAADTTAAPESSSPASAKELLEAVWGAYSEDDKFSAVGGDADNMTNNAPGKFATADGSAIDSSLGFPAAQADKLDDAASIVHMMNANTFTCGAYHAADAADVEALTAAIKENIMQRQWMCGFPDKLVIITVDDYILAAFGAEDLLDTFAATVKAEFSSAKTVCDEPVL